MTREKIGSMKQFLERMHLHADRAIKLSSRLSLENLNESDDLFWALVKYTENVEEAGIQIDKINKELYPALIEVDEDTWSDLKGMRSRLAHAFWNIDPTILWETVTKDFPVLVALLSNLMIYDEPARDGETRSFYFKTEHLLRLPDVNGGPPFEAGQSIVMVSFFHDGQPHVFRAGHVGNGKMVVDSNMSVDFSLHGQRK
jgi:uncharacterized protein with HEPN domain